LVLGVPPPDELEPVLDRARALEPERVVEPVRLFVVEPVLRDREPDAREVLERPREPDALESPSPLPESSSDPSSFFPTPTAAAVARPTAAPVTTFFGVDKPSFPSSSVAIVRPPSVPR
jgi:hypothetical protein